MAGYQLLEGHVVTERIDGAVYKTESVGYAWFLLGIAPHDPRIIWGPPSTKLPLNLTYYFGNPDGLPSLSALGLRAYDNNAN